MVLIEPQTLDQPTDSLYDHDKQPSSHHSFAGCFFQPTFELRCQPPASGMIGLLHLFSFCSPATGLSLVAAEREEPHHDAGETHPSNHRDFAARGE